MVNRGSGDELRKIVAAEDADLDETERKMRQLIDELLERQVKQIKEYDRLREKADAMGQGIEWTEEAPA